MANSDELTFSYDTIYSREDTNSSLDEPILPSAGMRKTWITYWCGCFSRKQVVS
jgi:hypothetical protein